MNGAQGKDAERAGYSVKKVVQVLKKPKCQCKCAVAKKASNSHKKLKEEDDEKVEKTQ
uniref:60S ribosomal protein L6 n=2 Tax=Bursaphelenchus xylophilus TaxID=6326 RepID=A0A1I7SIM7_BURXY